MDRPPCTVGECRADATRRLEIRRSPSDELPAEVRALCGSPTCAHLAMGSAAGFDRRLVPLLELADPPPPAVDMPIGLLRRDDEAAELRVVKIRRGLRRLEAEDRAPLTPAERDRATVEAAGFPPGIDYEALILAEDEERFGD